MQLYSDELCVHCKGLLSGKLKDSDLQRFIGRLQSLDPPTYLKYCSELSSLLALRLQGDTDKVQPDDFKVISLIPNERGLTYLDGGGNSYQPRYVPRDRILNEILLWDGSSATSQKTWAGLMKLKTAVAPRNTRRPSQSKLKEHTLSITEPFNGEQGFMEIIEPQVRLLTRMLIQHSHVTSDTVDEFYLPLTHHPEKDKAFAAISSDGLSVKQIKRNKLAAFNIRGFLRLQEIQDLYYEDPDRFIARLFVGTKVMNGSFDIEQYPSVPKGTTPLSIISFIPKPADKERVVAIPTAGMQSLSYPIGKVAKTINSSWKVQGVDSHKNTCEYISNLLASSNGARTFYSIDMSNFTDRLPYHGLTSVIVDELVKQNILSPFDAKVMDLVCDGCILLDNQVRSYGVGTPMGTFPSFPMASLTNGIIGAIAFAMPHLHGDVSKIRLDSLPMRIIGDDIVIWDDKTHKYYKAIMDKLGVTVQDSKCMQSNYVAEMCSKIITDHGVFQQKRVDSLASGEDLSALVDQIRYYGEEILSYTRPDLAEVVETLKGVPEPIGLAPSLEDPYWDERPVEKQIFLSLQQGSALEITRTVLDARDYDIIERRKKLYPKDLNFEVDHSVDDDVFKREPLLDSLARDVSSDMKILYSGDKATLQEKLDAAQRIQGLVTAFEILAPGRYDEYRYLSEDFHLHEPEIRPMKEEGGLTIAPQVKKAIELADSINHQVKEDEEYEPG